MMVAECFEKIRINPGNFADGAKKFEDKVYDTDEVRPSRFVISSGRSLHPDRLRTHSALCSHDDDECTCTSAHHSLNHILTSILTWSENRSTTRSSR